MDNDTYMENSWMSQSHNLEEAKQECTELTNGCMDFVHVYGKGNWFYICGENTTHNHTSDGSILYHKGGNHVQ